MKAVFLDRDGTIDAGIPKYPRVDSIEKVEILPSVIEALSLLSTLDYEVFIVTNQTGIAEGLISNDDFTTINDHVLKLIASSGVKIVETYVCPHSEDDNCSCRKPKPKMLLEAAAKYDVDLTESWMVGDRLSDVLTGINAGARTILVRTGAEVQAPQANYAASNLLGAVRYIAANS